jgi:hypothetical protein
MSAQTAHTAPPVPEPRESKRLFTVALALFVVGALLSAAAYFAGDTARVRFGFAYLWGFTFIWTVALGSLFFIALHHLAHAIWSVVVRRVAELLAAPMWLIGLLFVPVLLFALFNDQFHLFPWLNAAEVEHDLLLQGKTPYLNFTFWTIRAVAFFALWIGFTRFFVGRSLAQDRGEGGEKSTAKMRKLAAPFMLLFAASATFAGIDWLMSLEPHWFSTIFGVYLFAGMVLSSLAAITIITIWLVKSGRLGQGLITRHHLYNLGSLQFVFACFWAYIAFSQYMLIWYANLPEETFYLAHRLEGGWLAVSLTLTFTRFAIPFLALLSRHAKTNPRVLLWVSGLILTSQLVDLYWLIMPELHTAGPQLSWQELGPPILMVALLVLYCTRFLKRHSPLAVGDPLLDDSRKFHL